MDSDDDVNDLYQVDKMSLEETQEKLDWRKRAFEHEKKNLYGNENRNDMTRIHKNEVKIMAEYNLLHDTINLPKLGKNRKSITLLFYMDLWILEEVKQI